MAEVRRGRRACRPDRCSGHVRTGARQRVSRAPTLFASPPLPYGTMNSMINTYLISSPLPLTAAGSCIDVPR
jgi:hypothetical protein